MKKFVIFIILLLINIPVFALDNLLISGRVSKINKHYIILDIDKGLCKGKRKIDFSKGDYLPDDVKTQNLIGKNISVMVNSSTCKKEMKVINNLKRNTGE
ncbi:hypothetical protein Flexsi_0846 [Flexistipes sinusarabici DSM 4947]|uniref:DUF5666 domain-containing protein n=1 Tax=Flexistipes sinusarabici (strain ATCC 49648 / DSM 4947 / MAS 10) TaxID=717231 RepID=F8E4U0_FLESM|nr:hypothetical protein [Flexistipes sinusarabici]AEI14510.1 hypothetical protein Flexsi_0846 [Flexistipes sinusarabici DSM 4947]